MDTLTKVDVARLRAEREYRAAMRVASRERDLGSRPFLVRYKRARRAADAAYRKAIRKVDARKEALLKARYDTRSRDDALREAAGLFPARSWASGLILSLICKEPGS